MSISIKKGSYWSFIPARSGSKSIKNKNIRLINKEPLIAYSILIANKIKCEKVVFSSDSNKYLKMAQHFNKNMILHHRSKFSSSDTATDLDVFKEFCNFYISNNNYLPEFFIHLRPTTPFREIKVIKQSLSLFEKHKSYCTSLRSVYQMSNPSYKTFTIKRKYLCSLYGNDFNLDKYNIPKENFKNTYLPNGYIDIIKTKNILKNIFHGNKVLPFLINKYAIDIDNKIDFLEAKKFLEQTNQ